MLLSISLFFLPSLVSAMLDLVLIFKFSCIDWFNLIIESRTLSFHFYFFSVKFFSWFCSLGHSPGGAQEGREGSENVQLGSRSDSRRKKLLHPFGFSQVLCTLLLFLTVPKLLERFCSISIVSEQFHAPHLCSAHRNIVGYQQSKKAFACDFSRNPAILRAIKSVLIMFLHLLIKSFNFGMALFGWFLGCLTFVWK